MDQIVHICSEEDWQSAQAVGVYRPESLENEGFIHFSTPEQAVDTANRYYTGRTDLLLLWVDTVKLTAELRWEPSEGDVYPHLYGPLNLAAISSVTPFHPGLNGIFKEELPEKPH
jgi:uncharacterized protein (DUF952 family)